MATMFILPILLATAIGISGGDASPTTAAPNVTAAATAAAAACSANCSVTWSQPVYYYWTPLTYTTTIVAATVVQIINTVDGTTRTTTIVNKLASGYTAPKTNSNGTQVETITYTRHGEAKTTVLAFPSQFTSWVDAYTWKGLLPSKTTGAITTACLTASTSSAVFFPSFPFPEMPVTKLPRPWLDIPDPEGLYFKLSYGHLFPDNWITAYKDQGAVVDCTVTPPVFPANPALTARFMIVTSVSYEQNTPGNQGTARSGGEMTAKPVSSRSEAQNAKTSQAPVEVTKTPGPGGSITKRPAVPNATPTQRSATQGPASQGPASQGPATQGSDTRESGEPGIIPTKTLGSISQAVPIVTASNASNLGCQSLVKIVWILFVCSFIR